jgi:hypothetical protein
MSNVILMPSAGSDREPEELNYTGRVLCLNPEKGTRFQCGGFFLGPRRTFAVVDSKAQMFRLKQALDQGILIDITENKDIAGDWSVLQAVKDEDTGKKVYITVGNGGGLTLVGVDDPEVQAKLDKQIEEKRVIDVYPGFGEEDKYLLKVEP